MPNPTCLWCGEETEYWKKTPSFACTTPSCAAFAVPVTKEMLENYPVPAEIQGWEIVIAFLKEDKEESPVVTHEMQADWLGLFASAELATVVAGQEFDWGEAGSVLTWKVAPVVIKFKGGVP